MKLKLWHAIVLVVILSPLSVFAANKMWSAFSALTGANLASGDRIPFIDISDTTDGAGGTEKTITATELKDNWMHASPTIQASTSALAALTVTPGAVQTTATDGGIEEDADVFYFTTDAGNRGYVPARYVIRANATRTLPNDTNLDAIFNAPTNGRLTLEAGTYRVEGMLYITSMSSTTGNAQIDLLGAGTATTGSWLWLAEGIDATTPTNAAAQAGSFAITKASVASIVTAATGTSMAVQISGTFQVTGAGTIIPSIKQVTASASVVAIGSYLAFERMGSTSLVSVGQWD